MKTYLLFELKLFLKEAKNRIMFLIFACFLLFVYFLLAVQGVGNVEQEQAEEMNAGRVAISSIAAVSAENEDTAELYENIYEQQQLRTQQSIGIRLEDRDWYLDAGIEIAQLQIDLHTYDAFNDLDEALKNIVPSVHEASSDLARFTYMRDKDIPVMHDQKNVAGFMILYFSTFGIAAFVFLLLYSGSLLTNDLEHQTMVKGYPVTDRQKIISKLIIYVSASFLSICLLTGLAVLFVWMLHGSGNLAYPLIVYYQHAYYALPLTQYIFIYFGYLFLLTIYVVSLSVILNTLLKNAYATYFFGILSFVFPWIAERWLGWIWWMPVPYYNPFETLSGGVANSLNHNQLTFIYGGVVLVIWSMVFLVVTFTIKNLKDKR